MGTMRVLGKCGDAEIRWDRADEESVKKARKAFERYVASRFLAFSTSHPRGDATMIDDFDPDAHEVVVTRPLIGG